MLDKLKRTFSAGGVKVTLTQPKVLKPKNPTIPITITLTNRAKEERTVESVLFELREKSEQNEQNNPSYHAEGIQYLVNDPISLQPGQAHELTIDMPTVRDPNVVDVKLPGWAKAAGQVLSAAQRRPRNYEIRATTQVRGFNVAKSVATDLPGKIITFG